MTEQGGDIGVSAEASTWAAPTILIADDDNLLRSTMAAMFEKESYKVEMATNGTETVEKALNLHPQIAIVDYRMPEVDGVEAIRKIRADPWGANLPIIVATNSYDLSVMNEMMQLGVKDYILKNDTSLDEIRQLVTKYIVSKGR